MTKTEFTSELRRRLSGLPNEDIQGSLDFYTEMIDDRMEAGTPEEDAVASLGSPSVVAEDILLNLPLSKFSKVIKTKCVKKSKWRAWEIVLLVLGSPIWLSLGIAAVTIVLSVYLLLWAVMAMLWTMDVSLGALSLGCMVSGIVSASGGMLPQALLYLGTVFLCAGLAVAGFVGCLKLTTMFAKVSALILRWIKSLFISKKPDKKEAVA